MGDFYSGLLHPLRAPMHILILLGLSLWLGQHALSHLKTAFMVFSPVLAAALGLTLSGIFPEVPQPFLLLTATALGILVAAEKNLPAAVCGLFFGLSAFAVGLDSAVEGRTFGGSIQSLLGTWVSAHVILFDAAWYISRGERPWMKIGMRVAGSWIVAIAVLVLALSVKKSG